MCKVADHENHVRWIYLTTVLCMGECQKYARSHKNCVSKYVSPSSLAKLGNRGNDTDEHDDSKTGPKRLRSSTSAILDFFKHKAHFVAYVLL